MRRDREILLFGVLVFLTRIFFINWFTAERTDSIILITLFENKSNFWPPLYTFAMHLFHLLFRNWIISGRFVSILSGALAIVPLYLLSENFFGEVTARYTSLLYIFSPLIFRFNLKVLTDSLFLFLFLSSTYFFFLALERKNIFSCFWFSFLSGLSTLTRYEGFVFLPFLIYLFLKKNIKKSPLFLGIIGWLPLILWIYYRGFGHISQYGERLVGMNIREFLLWGESLTISFAYVLTYPVFLFSLYTMFHLSHEEKKKEFTFLTLILFFFWLPPHILFHSFQLRYFLPLIPFFLILASEGLRKVKFSRIWISICLLFSITFTSLSLIFQKDTFGDVKRSAEWVRKNVRKEWVYSDEYWKTRFWSKKRIRKWEGREKKEDVLVLHSGYSNITEDMRYISRNYNYRLLYSTHSRILPLLPDILYPPQISNSPYWIILKYTFQDFHSSVIKIEGKK